MTERGKQPGNIGELLTMGMCVLALTVVMLNYLQNVQLLQAKENVGQLARAYLLKMETGKSAQEYIQLAIMERVKELLAESNKTISEIAYELGFKYPHHLSRIFKKVIGITPNEYRLQVV